MSEVLCLRIARERRIPPPALAATLEQPAELDRWARRVWQAFPGWGFDAAFLDEQVRGMLPRALAIIGLGRARARIGRGFDVLAMLEPAVLGARPYGQRANWPRWREMMEAWPALGARDPRGEVLRFDLTPGDETPLLLHPVSLEWDCAALARRGDGIVALAAWRWELSEAKAAWRFARRWGLERPYP